MTNNIKIDQYGILYITRCGKWREQICPYASTTSRCGDWCPMFREPENGVLIICRDAILYDNLTDLRLCQD